MHESDGNSRRAYAMTRAREVIAGHGTDLAGYAVMAWTKDGTSTCDSANLAGNIPTILIPDFVRNRLLAHRIEEWTLEEINGD